MSTYAAGTPCWADLWTSDVEASRRFYPGLLGWDAGEPDAAHGGYFMFLRQGAPVAGGMGPMAGMPADDRWKPFFATDDIEATAARVAAAGGQVVAPAMPVDELGTQAVTVDPTGAPFGLWQPGQFAGFGATGVDGTPSWFELHTPDHPAAVAFYREALGVEVAPVSDTDELRYWTFRSPGAPDDAGGIVDNRAWLATGQATWSIYWEVDDLDGAVERAKELGGTVSSGPDDTPYGRLAVVLDPAGAELRLRTSPRR